MKTYKQIINEVAAAQSPADKEFVALHRIAKKGHPVATEVQFKGGTEKDHTKLSKPSDETGAESAVEKEKPKTLGEWRDHLEESVHMKDAMAARAKGDDEAYHNHMAAHFDLQRKAGKTQSYRDTAEARFQEHDKLAKKFEKKEVKESADGPYMAAAADAKKVMHKDTHSRIDRAFKAMNDGGDESEELKKHDLHNHKELHPILKKHGIGA